MTQQTEFEALIKSLRIKADMIRMGERIAWGSETKLMYQAADALEALQRQSAWQPIETAPKDGTRILVYGTYQWENYYERQEEGIICAEWYKITGANDNGSWNAISTNPYCDFVQPTHWMPLPTPPEKSGMSIEAEMMEEAISLLQRARDHLLIKEEKRIKAGEITAFIKRWNEMKS